MTALSLGTHSDMFLNQAYSLHRFIRNLYAGCSLQKGVEQYISCFPHFMVYCIFQVSPEIKFQGRDGDP